MLTMLKGTPSPALRRYATQFTAYREHHPVPVHRREHPFGGVVLILGFTEPLQLSDPRRSGASLRLASFTGGLTETFTDTTTVGRAEGVQVNLTPLGARRIFGLPMSELANQIVPVEDLLGPFGTEMIVRLAETSDWHERLRLLDRLLTDRLSRGPDPGPRIQWAWARLVGSNGAVGVGELADRLGWSHRHLIARFREEIGLPPKTVGRILRFSHARRLIEAGVPLADAAVRCGYYDQAHMNRDFRAMAGVTPAQVRIFQAEQGPAATG